MIGRNGDEAAIADHINQNFHPHGHDAPFPKEKLRKGQVSSCIIRRSDPRDRMARDCGYAGSPLIRINNEKPRRHPKMLTGSFMLSPLARLLHLRGKHREAGFVPAIANFPGEFSLCTRLRFDVRRQPRRVGKPLSVPPQRQNDSPRSVQRIGQGRFAVLFTLALELLLGFPEARDTGCDFGPIAREVFFPSPSSPIRVLFDLRSAIIGAREWGTNAEARLQLVIGGF